MNRRRASRWGRVLGLLLVPWVFAAPLRGEDKDPITLIGENRAAALRIAEARKRLDARKWSEAIEELQTILNTASNDLVPIAPDHSVQAGWLCRVQLASLPAEALRLYRQRYESQAQKKLEQARAEHDVLQLRKLVEDAFCTRAAEKAIDLLGDLALERGRFEEAEEWWRLLAPLPDPQRDAAPRGLALVYPDLSLDPARVQAKQLLARIFQRTDADWRAALASYRQRHAKTEGTLGGRKGRYAELLQTFAVERKDQRDAAHEGWTTFGGDFSRGQPISAPADILDRLSELCRQGPTWTFDLERRAAGDGTEPAPAVNVAQARRLAFHPVIAGHHALVADARYVTAFDLRNGQSEQWYDVGEKNGGVKANLKLPAPPDLRYTLTVADNLAYVRLGAQDIGIETPGPQRGFGPALPRRDRETFLACLSQRPDETGDHFRWKIDSVFPRDPSLFEGAPIVAGGLIWIASTRYQGNNDCLTSIDCYTAHDNTAPPLRWRCEICKTPQPKAGEPRYRHHLLTLAGTQTVTCTHTGAIIAVDALTGRRNWAIRYPQRKLDGADTGFRDLMPVLFTGGRLYAAPADSDTLLCLEPATGRTLWELEPVRGVHLLGVGQGRLIFTTPQGLRAVRADNGNPVWAVPDAGGDLTPAGRGLLIGDLVLFPTTQPRDPGSPWRQNMVYALRQSDGQPADDPARLHRLPAGNLAFGNGCLAVADQRTLSVFVPPRLLLDKRKAEAPRHPSSAAASLDLAQAQADAGRNEDALRTLDQAEAEAQALPASRREHLLGRLRLERQRLLLEMARDYVREKRWEDAKSAFRDVQAVPLSPRGRLHGLLHAAQIWQNAGETRRARGVWETVLADEQLRQIQVIDRDGKPISALDYAAAHVPSGERGVSTPGFNSTGALTRPARRDVRAPSLPLVRAWHIQLGSNEWILDGWQKGDPESLLIGSPDGRFFCRLASTGETRWQARLPFAPHWAGCWGDTILAAGDKGVACLRREDGQLIWHFPALAAGRYPRARCEEVHVILDPRTPESLTDFQLAGDRLYFLQGQRRLFALSAATGAVLWHLWAPDGALHLPYPHGCFSSCYHAGAETMLIHASGRRWLLDGATGGPICQTADSRSLWQRPPLELDDRTLCVVRDNRHLLLLAARTGQVLWEREASEGATLSGELPWVLGHGNLLLYVQPANIGYFLHRLDRASGKSIWPRPQLITAKTVDPTAWTFDADAMYGIEDDSLIARALANGGSLWRRPLSGDGRRTSNAWQARRVGDYLIVSPRSTRVVRFRFRSPLGPLQWDLGSLAKPEAIFPVACYDPKTGQLVQRWNLRLESTWRTTPPKRRTQEEGGRAWIVRTSSLLTSEDGPVIRLDGPYPFIAAGGEVWGLTESKSNFTAR